MGDLRAPELREDEDIWVVCSQYVLIPEHIEKATLMVSTFENKQ